MLNLNTGAKNIKQRKY